MVLNAAELEKNTKTWNADRFALEATRLLSAIVRGDRETIVRLSEEYTNARIEQRGQVPLPIDPWTDTAVLFGALLALSEISEIATRMVIPSGVLRSLLTSTETRNILLRLAGQPGGVVKQSRIPDLTGIHRANAHRRVEELKTSQLLSLHKADPKGTVVTVQLTNLGWAAVELLREWNLDQFAKEDLSIEKLLSAGVSARHLADTIGGLMHSADAFESGFRLAQVLLNQRTANYSRKISRAIRYKLKESDNKETVKLTLGLLGGIHHSTPHQFLEVLHEKVRSEDDVATLRWIVREFNESLWQKDVKSFTSVFERKPKYYADVVKEAVDHLFEPLREAEAPLSEDAVT